jgi:hypothetical protein
MPRVVIPGSTYERILIYGPPKAGKSRLAAAASRAGFGPKLGYVCADPPADMLSSICAADHGNVLPIEPRPEVKDGKMPRYDPLKEAVACATWPWEDEVGTLVWDTLTSTGDELLAAVALSEQAPADSHEGRITFGAKGTSSYVVTPSRSDYGSGQGLIRHLLRHLFNQQRHVIVVCHQGVKEPAAGSGGVAIGGPATIGSSMLEKLSGWFTSSMRVETKTKVMAGNNGEKVKRTQFVVRTRPHGIWVAGVRTPNEPMGDVVLDADPVNFWHAYRQARGLEDVSNG